MAVLRLIFLALALVSHAAWCGEEQIIFAVPSEGRVTLGVFDDHGKLVRRLHELTPESDFKKGLNGLITSWDGADDSGHRLPAGRYYVRGYLAGDVEVHGERFHFDDWITETADPEIVRIDDFHLLPNFEAILIAGKVDGTKAALRFSPEAGFRWIRAIPAEAGASAVDAEWLHIVAGENVLKLALENGEPGESRSIGAGAPVTAASASEGGLDLARGTEIVRLTAQGVESGGGTPVVFASIDSGRASVLGSGDGRVFLRRAGTGFDPLQVPGSVLSAALGMGDTFWFVAGDGNGTFVGQSSFAGELLRALKPDEGEPLPRRIRASTSGEVFGVLEDGAGLQRMRIMSRSEDTGWTVEWERSSRAIGAFGFRDGEVVPETVEAPAELAIRTEKNPLAGGQPVLRLHLVVDGRGGRIETPDGLPLAVISERTDLTRGVMIRGEEPDSARVLLGQPTAVAEFTVKGLRHIQPLDVGPVELRE